jgi:hypothetical protein
VVIYYLGPEDTALSLDHYGTHRVKYTKLKEIIGNELQPGVEIMYIDQAMGYSAEREGAIWNEVVAFMNKKDVTTTEVTKV